MNRMLPIVCCAVIAWGCFTPAAAQANKENSSPQTQSSAQVPVMNGGAGPCSLEVTVTDIDSKPIYAATVKVHITYGFAGVRKLDLEAGTNSDGKLKFTGIPARVHDPPLAFHVSKGDLAGFATVDPSSECEGKRRITVMKKKPEEDR